MALGHELMHADHLTRGVAIQMPDGEGCSDEPHLCGTYTYRNNAGRLVTDKAPLEEMQITGPAGENTNDVAENDPRRERGRRERVTY